MWVTLVLIAIAERLVKRYAPSTIPLPIVSGFSYGSTMTRGRNSRAIVSTVESLWNMSSSIRMKFIQI